MKKYLCVICAILLCGCGASERSNSDENENITSVWDNCDYITISNIEIPIAKNCKANEELDDWYSSGMGDITFDTYSDELVFSNDELDYLKSECTKYNTENDIFDITDAEKVIVSKHEAFTISGTQTFKTDFSGGYELATDEFHIYLNSNDGHIEIKLRDGYAKEDIASEYLQLINYTD